MLKESCVVVIKLTNADKIGKELSKWRKTTDERETIKTRSIYILHQ